MKSKLLFAMYLFIGCYFVVHSAYAGMNVQKDCMINSGACIKEIKAKGLQVIFDINPKPVLPMKDLVFNVTLTDKKGPVTDASVSVDLTMPGMFMGINRPVLVHKGNGKYEGRGVIPRCPHGGKAWRAEVRITRQGRTASVDFTFEVK